MALLQQLVFASGNAGKARELGQMLGDSVELILQGDLGIESVEETGTTFTDNALLKARHAAQASGLPAQIDVKPHWSGIGFSLLGNINNNENT